MEEYINVFIGNDKLLVKNNISFKDLRLKILNEKKRLIKYFSFGDKKINENILKIFLILRLLWTKIFLKNSNMANIAVEDAENI